MFFIVDLLIPQHGGKFALAWLAATRGIGHTSKKEIVACDITRLCDEILEMVQSSSTRPRLRLSLSLASRLINGVSRIYKAQVEILRDEAVAFLTTVRKPVVEVLLSQDGSGETLLTPVTRPQRKRKRRTIEFSEELTKLSKSAVEDFTTIRVVIDDEELARPSAHQVDADLITLREELPIHSHDQMALELEEEQLQEFPRILQDAPLPPLEMPIPTIREKRKTKETPLEKITEVTDVSVQELPLQLEIQPIFDVPPQSELQAIVETPLQPEIQIVPDIEQGISIQRDQSQIVPEDAQVQTAAQTIPSTTKKPQIVDKLTYKPITKRRVLDRIPERCYIKDLLNQVPVHLIKPGSVNLCNLIEHSMVRTQTIEDFIMEAPLSAKSRESLLRSSTLFQSRIPRHGLSTRPDGTPVPEIQITPIIPQEAHEVITYAEVHATSAQQELLQLKEIIEPQFPSLIEIPERTVQPLAESTQVQPMYIEEQITMHPPERTIELELPPAAEAPLRKEAVIKNFNEVGKKKILAKDRQKRIRDIVKNWDTNVQGPIALEDVCFQPVNCLNIATAFSDLLSLHKMGYVKLHNKSDSLELGLIEKGERLLRKK